MAPRAGARYPLAYPAVRLGKRAVTGAVALKRSLSRHPAILKPGTMLLKRRILITRPRNVVSALDQQLRAQGAITIAIPAIALVPPASTVALDRALHECYVYDLTVFLSPSAVEAFATRSSQLGVAACLRRAAVVGPSTAAALRASGIDFSDPHLLMPAKTFTSEALAACLVPHVSSLRVLLPQSALSPGLLAGELRQAGAQVTEVTAYDNILPEQSVYELTELLATSPPDAVTFTSASTARNFAALLLATGLALPAGTVLASIGPTTSEAMRSVALEPTLEAAVATIPALVEALATYFAGR